MNYGLDRLKILGAGNFRHLIESNAVMLGWGSGLDEFLLIERQSG